MFYIKWKILKTGQIKSSKSAYPKEAAQKIVNWLNRSKGRETNKIEAWLDS